jgi:hypothetical protein
VHNAIWTGELGILEKGWMEIRSESGQSRSIVQKTYDGNHIAQ